MAIWPCRLGHVELATWQFGHVPLAMWSWQHGLLQLGQCGLAIW